MYKSKSNLPGVLFFAIFSLSVFACGPGFPNSYLMSGDEKLIGSPVFNFYEELDRIQLEKPAEFRVVYDIETIPMDIQELTEVLENQGHTSEKIEQTVSAYRSIREAIEQYKWNCRKNDFDHYKDFGKKLSPRITFSVHQIPKETPAEFSLYLQGVIYYQTGELVKAIDAWLKILALPASQRQYRSTWAMYMMGKCARVRPHLALLCFQRVRQLARKEYRDSLGLAASSYGQEAAVHLEQKQYDKAIDLYLLQKQTSDRSAEISLKLVSSAIFKNCSPKEISELVKHPWSRHVLASYAISATRYSWRQTREKDEGQPLSPQQALLAAIEQAYLGSVEQADRMAMIAYQAGDFEKAQRWLSVADLDSFISRRVRAKLYLREGKIKEAAEDLAFIARQAEPGKLIASYEYDRRDTPYKLHSELGSLYVSQAMYLQALDTLMKGGNWIDAAYIAERVLTPEELQHYVDANWPAGLTEPEYTTYAHEGWYSVRDKATEIRYLLARRLTRLQRYNEARPYYPEEWLEDFDTFVAALDTGNNTVLFNDDRADALWMAAWLARHRGMELMGTELDPDWHIYHGSNAQSQRLDLRQSAIENNYINIPSQQEIDRAQTHITLPEERFHYRYIASDLAWEAASLMPNEDVELARRLCLAGTWHRDRDNQHADVFYKSLVLRCGTTALGKEADRIRWFPKISDTLKYETPVESQ